MVILIASRTMPRPSSTTSLIPALRRRPVLVVLVVVFSVSVVLHLVCLSSSSRSIHSPGGSDIVVEHMKAVVSGLPRDAHLFTDDLSYYRNACAMAQQREHLETLCKEERKYQGRSWIFPTSTDTTTSIGSSIEKAFAVALDPPTRNNIVEATTPTPIQPCDRVFWDLGANIGDSIVDYTEALFHDLSCHPNKIRVSNLESGRLTDAAKSSNKDKSWRGTLLRHHALRHSNWVSLGDWIAYRMKEAPSRRHPEDYCYFGLEGNPELTDRLHKLAARTMQTVPRPVRSITFLTETVITDQDGLVEMFVEEGAGMGSTLLEGKSKHSHKTILEKPAMVKAVTLETLLAETVVLGSDSHLIIKMDVEGAEYMVLNHGWKALCRAVQVDKVHVGMMLELHGKRKIGQSDALEAFYRENILGKLTECGVHVAMDSFSLGGGRRYHVAS